VSHRRRFERRLRFARTGERLARLASTTAVSALNFRCTACGNCCRNLRVAVTSLDVARLAAARAAEPSSLVAWLAPDAVDMTGEPESFVELDEGRRLMVLAQRDGACLLLGADNRCGAYAARPRDCRTFPFDFAETNASHSSARHLTLLPLQDCEYDNDGHNDAELLDAEDQARWSELFDYRALVARWNRRAWHRRRLQRRVGDAAAFLAFALAPSPQSRR
jgi:Fe-S-cluster containining protein